MPKARSVPNAKTSQLLAGTEDIVVVTDDGARRLNTTPHDLAVVH